MASSNPVSPGQRYKALEATRGFPPGTIGYGVHRGIDTLYYGHRIFGGIFRDFLGGGFRDRFSARIGDFFSREDVQSLMGRPINDKDANLQVATKEVEYWTAQKSSPSAEDRTGAELALLFSAEDRAKLQLYFGNGKDDMAYALIKDRMGPSVYYRRGLDNLWLNLKEWWNGAGLSERFPSLNPEDIVYASLDENGIAIVGTGTIPLGLIGASPSDVDFDFLARSGSDQSFAFLRINDQGAPIDAVGVIPSTGQPFIIQLQQETESRHALRISHEGEEYVFDAVYVPPTQRSLTAFTRIW